MLLETDKKQLSPEVAVSDMCLVFLIHSRRQLRTGGIRCSLKLGGAQKTSTAGGVGIIWSL